MSESKVIKGNFYTVMGWMITDLHLKGNELAIFAIIYGFSQAENQKYTGSLQYLADWTNSTKQGVSKNLKSLVEKGYIDKTQVVKNGITFVEYKVVDGIKLCLMGYTTKFNGGIQQSLTNNIDNNTIDNNNSIIKENIIKEKPSKSKKKYPTFEEQIESYTENEKVKSLLYEFIEYRQKEKKFTEFAFKIILGHLTEYSTNDDEKIQLLERTIEHGWKTVYPLKKEEVKNATTTGDFHIGEDEYL